LHAVSNDEAARAGGVVGVFNLGSTHTRSGLFLRVADNL
jgi:hypothetical protein